MAGQMDFVGNVMPQLLNAEASEEKGENARLSSFVGAIAVADLVKTTLGPKGMDKILKPMDERASKITITNDGATILNSVYLDNAAAKIIVGISQTQDKEVGDGTTTVAVLAGELLREAEKLVDGRIHPQTIIKGWRLARDTARKTLESLAQDHRADEAKFREDLLKIARTTLSSKLLTHEKEHFAEMAVDAVLRLKGSSNLDYIKMIKKPGGNLRDSYLDEGFILEKSISVGCPLRKENPKIMVANTPMDTDKIKIHNASVKVDSMDDIAKIEQAEKDKMKKKVEKILAHKPDVFINRQLVYNYPEQLFAEAGVMCIEHADFDGVERLAAVTGGDILSTFDNIEQVKLGECSLVEEVMIGEDKLIKFSGCKANEACSIVLRGSSTHLLDEAERSLHDVVCVLTQTIKNSKVVYGGGFTEMSMARAVNELGDTVTGKESYAIHAFANALRQLPSIIAENAGYDASELIAELRAGIAGGDKAGLDMNNGCVGNMEELGVVECFRVKEQALMAASEAAEMILRVDEIVKCAPRRREG